MSQSVAIDDKWIADMEARVRSRKSAEALVLQAGELLKPKIAALPDDACRRQFWEMMLSVCKTKLGIVDPPAEETKAKRNLPDRTLASDADASPDRIEEAMSLVRQILDYAEDIPSRGEGFASSVCEKANDIAASIEKFGRVTDGQLEALDNMLGGVLRWLD